MNDRIKQSDTQPVHVEHRLVFVVPTYGWRIPRIVEQWIQVTEFTGAETAWFVMDCGGEIGNAAKYIRRLCKQKGFIYMGAAPVIMPENYIALSVVPSERECEDMITRARPVFSELAQRIGREEPFPNTPVSIGGRFLSGPFNPLYYRFYIRDKGFTVSSACVSCGRCARRCPLNNIGMADGKPVWKGNCTHCMACICGCPTEAIEYKSISKGKRRYYRMEE